MIQQASQRRGMSLQRGRSVVHLRLSSMHARRPRHSQQVRVKTFTFIFRIETLFSALFHRKHSRDQCLIDFSTRCRSVRAVDVCFGSSRLCNWIYGAPTAPRANARPKTLRWSWKLWGLNLCKFNIRFSLYLLWCACNGNNFARKNAQANFMNFIYLWLIKTIAW